MPAAAKGDGRATAQPEDLAFLIDDLKIPFHAKGSVAKDCYFGARHEFLRLSDCKASSAITITRDTKKDKKVAERLRSVRRGIRKKQGKVPTPKRKGVSHRMQDYGGSVSRHGRIDFCRPRQDAAAKIQNLAEARLPHEIDGLCGTLSGAAVRHDLVGRIEFVDPARQFPDRNEVTFQIANLVFVGFADVENEELIALIEALLQFPRGNFGHIQIHIRNFFATDAAELVVVDELMNCRVRPAHGAVGILAQLQFAKLRSQRVEQEQPADQRFAAPDEQLDGLHRLQ